MRKTKWLRWILIAVIALFAASAGLSRAMRTSRARNYLTAHLEASFGRPVEVGRFDFSLLDGIRLEAHSVTVSEDPQFGHEYFLRADTLTAGLRWPALLAGRFEFGTLSLARPSVNFVRNARGQWNVAQWLPPASPSRSAPGAARVAAGNVAGGAARGAVEDSAGSSFAAPMGPRSVSPARLYRIDIDGGRINFKQGDDKSPFALLDVVGRLEQDSRGQWTLDLEARPMRAGVELQQIGTIALRGTIGGTSTRLQPADLRLTWRDVSVADALRLASQSDYGTRGEISLDLTARVAPPVPGANDASAAGAQWSISGLARLTGVHGWQLPGRPTDPAVNLSMDAAWQVGAAAADVTKLLVEMPGSRLQGSCELDWRHGFHPRLHIESSSLGLGDLVSWYRAFSPGVREDLDVAGTLGVDATLSGWPLQLTQGALASVGGRITAGALPPLRIGAINASVSRGGLDFAPTEISFPSVDGSPNAFVIRGSIFPGNSPGSTPVNSGALLWPANWTFSIDGGTSRIEDWLAFSNQFAQPPTYDWAATGGLAMNLRGARRIGSPATWLGTADFRGLTTTPSLINQPLRFPRAHVEFSPSQRTIALSSAGVFGATWQGSVTRDNAKGQWTFDLSADHLDASELDRWLGPRARPGLLARITGFGKPADNTGRDAAVALMAARGRLRIAELTLGPLRLERFDGETQIAGRTITALKTQADFFGGQVTGSFEARLIADPSYRFSGHLAQVDLARLGRAMPWLANRISGTGWSAITLFAHGVGRENLVGSLEGDGTIDARSMEFRGLNFGRFVSGATADSLPSQPESAKGSFHIAGGAIETSDLVLDDSHGRFQAQGHVDFSHALNFQIRSFVPQTTIHTTTSTAHASPLNLLLSGTVEAPNLADATPTVIAPARPLSPIR